MIRPLRLLLIEDSPDDAELILLALRRHGFVPNETRVQTASELREALASGVAYDAVISDFSLPSFSGPAALAVVQESGRDLPFLLVSGTIADEAALAAMKAGAHDYLMKDDLRRLGAAIEREVREAGIRRERRDSERALRETSERFRIVGQATSDVVWDRDLARGEIWVSEAIQRGFGWRVEKVSVDWWRDRIHPEDRARVVAGVEAIVGEGTGQWSGEFQVRARRRELRRGVRSRVSAQRRGAETRTG